MEWAIHLFELNSSQKQLDISPLPLTALCRQGHDRFAYSKT